MIRTILFAALAALLVAYSFWIYARAELRVPAGPRLALLRAAALVVVLLLVFNPRLPLGDGGGAPARWVLLDASLSMSASGEGGTPAWEAARTRAEELAADGWTVVRFGDDDLARGLGGGDDGAPAAPDRLQSRLAPALSAAAESGARRIRVLTDGRLEDAVAVRSALETLPLDVVFETFGGRGPNTGIARFEVPDVSRADGAPEAELDVFGAGTGDSVRVEVFEEGRPVATVALPAPSPGLRATATVALPPPAEGGRVRYAARVVGEGDGFPDDDSAVAYANVGFESGGVVLVSLRPDWEPRQLLPVLEEVTGLPASGFLGVGEDRFLPMGRAIDRGGPVDSATVRRAAREATLLILHGPGRDAPQWIAALARAPGRVLTLPSDPDGAGMSGLDVRELREGEWYVSPDVPTSPIAGSLSGVVLDGLPPLTDVLVPETPLTDPPLLLQLRGAGPPESALALVTRAEGRTAIALASGFWRWAMRERGREPYRSLWSGVAGWLLADRTMATPEPRPVRWVFGRTDPVEWRTAGDSSEVRVRVEAGDSVVRDTVLSGGSTASLGTLPPGAYRYTVVSGGSTDTLATGRFDVASTTLEMLPRGEVPLAGGSTGGGEVATAPAGLPIRTSPWPYLLVITLLCGEWIIRRRSGLR